MAKGTLTFDLPEEESEFKNAVNGTEWALVVWDIHQSLCKQMDNAISDTHAEILQEILIELNSYIENRNLSLNMIE